MRFEPPALALLACLTSAAVPSGARDEEPLPQMTVHSVQVGDQGRVWIAGTAPGDLEARFHPGTKDTDFGLLCVSREGSANASFGAGGLVRVHFGGDPNAVVPTTNEEAFGLALVDGGRSGAVLVGLAGGMGPKRLAAARLDERGAPVGSFAQSGRFELADHKARASTVRLAPDGALLVAGQISSGGQAGMDVHVVRFTAAGAVDAAFGSGGDVPGAVIDRGREDGVRDAEWIDGALWVLVGDRFRVARVTAAGALDADFGSDGWFELEEGAQGWALEPRPGGGALVVGTTPASADERRKVFRFVALGPDGALDAAPGIVDWDPDTGGEVPIQAGATRGLVVDDAGGFLVYAELMNGIASTPNLFRFDAAGKLVDSWGTGGRLLVQDGSFDPFGGLAGAPTPHHMVRDGDRALVADTLFANDDVGNTRSFVWLRAFDL